MRELDVAELAARATRAARTLHPAAAVTAVRALSGGQSSLTFAATLESAGTTREVVLKVAPPGLPPVRNRDVLRQAMILRALSRVRGMCVPTVLFDDAGEPPDVPPLFAMSYVAGESTEPHLTTDSVSDTDVAGRARHAARLLALLHRQHPGELGLTDRPTTSTEELGRWVRALETVTEYVGDTTALVASLRAAMPDDQPPRLVHGDFRLGNMLARGNRVEAVIDWEIWSIADPRIDLAWFLLTADARWHPTAIREHPGMPPAAVLLEEYESAGGPASTAHAPWFRALSLTKMAASTALITKHHRRLGEHEQADATSAPIARMLRRAADALAGTC